MISDRLLALLSWFVMFFCASLLMDVVILVDLLIFNEYTELVRLSLNESVSILETFRRIFPDGEPKNLTSYLQVLEQSGKTGKNTIMIFI